MPFYVKSWKRHSARTRIFYTDVDFFLLTTPTNITPEELSKHIENTKSIQRRWLQMGAY